MTPLHTLRDFLALDHAARRELGRTLVEALGSEWWLADDLVGDDKLVSLVCRTCGTEFVVIPGGEFEMGVGPADEAACKVLEPTPFVRGFLEKLERVATPSHRRHIAPFLLSRDRLSKPRLQMLKRDWPTDEFLRRTAVEFVDGTAFRLPSEAEMEWAIRAGGVDVFVCDLAATHQPGRSYSIAGLENRWGLADLLLGQWVADDWHDDYEGAPVTAEPWMEGDDAGVLRGGLGSYVEADTSLLYALAAHRSHGDYAEGLIGMRLVADLPMV